MTRDPAAPEFWDRLFNKDITPWEAESTPPELETWLDAHPEPGRVLIPGCGSAWEALSFDRRDWDVTALDFSPLAIDKAKVFLADNGFRGRLVCDDFFTHKEEPYTLIYERAFLASFPRHLRVPWGNRIPQLLQDGGLLMGCFLLDDNDDLERPIPPFALESGELTRLLGSDFTQTSIKPTTTSVEIFKGREWWQEWTYHSK